MGIIFFKARLKAQRRPPGPRGYPIIGNLLDLPSARDWTATIQDWGKRWGDLISLSVLGTDLIFINSYSMAVDHLIVPDITSY
ncbi:hypothetical protein C8J56DRAFT_6994 [Mycena floridula]|nr:hypothetical protein C8J56DRAFT_6994 [Mycena floridula]